MRLLAKDPSEHPGSANDALSALDGIDLGTSVVRWRAAGNGRPALEDALSGRGRLVTLVGEPGIGKTRTAQELATMSPYVDPTEQLITEIFVRNIKRLQGLLLPIGLRASSRPRHIRGATMGGKSIVTR